MPTHDPQREFAIDVVRRLSDAGFRALWAGGCVRDFLLEMTPKDYDVATNAVPHEVRHIFGKHSTQTVGANFGVIIVHGPKNAGTVEVATFRTDGAYLDGRRPESVEFSTPKEDAHRRDFTINGMFYDPIANEVLDFVNGQRDLKAKIVRAIGDSHDRVREDKLRMLRAVRFAAALDFKLDDDTAAAIREMATEIHVVSVERITHELQKMLVDQHRARAMRLANDVGILSEFLPELRPILDNIAPSPGSTETWTITLQMLQQLENPGFELAMATLLLETKTAEDSTHIADLCRRLRMSNRETDRIMWLLQHRNSLQNAGKLTLAELKRLAAHEAISELLSLYRVRLEAKNADQESLLFMKEFLKNTPLSVINPPELLSGNDLVQLGMQPGPQFKKVLTAVRDAQLNEEIHTRDQSIAFVKTLPH